MDLQAVKARLERRHARRIQHLESQRTRLLETLRNSAPRFVRRFPDVTKIVVFGSVVRPGYFREQSDVDLCVAGLPNAEYWQARLWLERCLGTERIDLVRLEDAREGMRPFVERGIVIYDKDS